MEGSLIIRVCLLGLLATTAIASLIHRTSEIDSGSEASLADIGARFEKQNVDFYPELPEPTDEEWIAIINGNWPEYLKETNFSLEANTTGTFSNTDGFKGDWNQTTYASVRLSDDVVQVFVLDLQMLMLDGFPVALLELIAQVYREVGGGVLTARATTGAAFVKKNGTYDLFGRSMSFRQGSNDPGLEDDSRVFSHIELSLTNSSFFFTVTGSLVDGEQTHKDIHYKYNATIGSTSIPLNRDQVGEKMPRTAKELVQLLKEEEGSSEVTGGFGDFSGDFTSGKKGTYSARSLRAAFSQSGANVNTTTSLHGNYWEVSSDARYFQFFPTSLIDIMFKGIF